MALYIILIILIVAVLALLVYRATASVKKESIACIPAEYNDIDEDGLAKKLSGAICFKTISAHESCADEFPLFHGYLRDSYPMLHQKFKVETIEDHSLLYRWETGSSEKPVLLMAHLDVVPINEGTETDWKHDPFGGIIEGGYIWGRGTLDMKGQLVCIFESLEYLIDKGFEPSRDIYIALGHDEELPIEKGAVAIAELCKQRGMEFELVLDEGMSIYDGNNFGIKEKAALIGLAEKGYAEVKITAVSNGGHSSMPPANGAVVRLAKAIENIEKNGFPRHYIGLTKAMTEQLSPYMRFPLNIYGANLPVFGRLVLNYLCRTPLGRAMFSTTAAITMLQGSVKANILPQKAEAIVNCRMLPGEDIGSVKQRLVSIIGEGYNIEILNASEASKVSSMDSFGFKCVKEAASVALQGCVAAPAMTIVSTDSRLFEPLCNCVCRFSPFPSLARDIGGIHGTNERLEVSSLRQGAIFFVELLKRVSGDQPL